MVQSNFYGLLYDSIPIFGGTRQDLGIIKLDDVVVLYAVFSYGRFLRFGETGRTIETRLKDHKRHLRLGQPEKSAIAEHSIQHDHVIQFDDAEILMRSTKYWDRVVKEVIEIRLDHKNFNRDAGYAISNTWKPVLSALKSQRTNGLAAKRPVLNQSRDT
ncbi:uncharacterized protein LOC124173964 [Ischnura elegans]|uniref:uncharacterized protein LOC124173964 n=1 Tax=Ischnura elegans TaxID=197161 RepID=UPI001ED8B029|nr:uncharacterized protein LOC124173964 [Ischnura elegans]